MYVLCLQPGFCSQGHGCTLAFKRSSRPYHPPFVRGAIRAKDCTASRHLQQWVKHRGTMVQSTSAHSRAAPSFPGAPGWTVSHASERNTPRAVFGSRCSPDVTFLSWWLNSVLCFPFEWEDQRRAWGNVHRALVMSPV